MKFLIIVMMVRYLFTLLDRLSGPDEEYQTEERSSIHPSEYGMR